MTRVLHVTSEVAPWSQTGGLGEVLGALPAAQVRHDPHLEVAVLAPLYRETEARVRARGARLEPTGVELTVVLPVVDLGARVVRLAGAHSAAGDTAAAAGGAHPRIYFLDCPPLYDRDGLYGDAAGDYGDNAVRFGFLARAALSAGPLLFGAPVDIYHAHDWQVGLLPLYLGRLGGAAGAGASIFTVHNLAFQGLFDSHVVADLGLPWSLYEPHTLEHFGRASFLKGGLAAADLVTTVSPSYAHEILTPRFGEGLDGFLRHDVRRVIGILNGIDEDAWDPARDRCIAAPYSADDLAGKRRCRHALMDERHLKPSPGDLVVGMVTRLTEQKGVDLVADLVPELHSLGVRLVMLGSGEAELESRFRWLAERFRHHLSITIGFDLELARRIAAGVDAMIMPSRFEPCGLTQMIAMRYGTVPVVSPVGGLRDTVEDPGDARLAAGDGTGFVMTDASAPSLARALGRAAAMHRKSPAGWQRLMQTGLRRDVSWREPARAYAEVYRSLMSQSRS